MLYPISHFLTQHLKHQQLLQPLTLKMPFKLFEDKKAYAIWQLMWEYGHTALRIFILPLTDPWIRRMFDHFGWAPKELFMLVK